MSTLNFVPVSEQHIDGDFKMRFPQKAETDYVALPRAFKEDQTELTISFWVKTVPNGPLAIFSYAVPGNDDEIRIALRADGKIRAMIGANDA